VLPVESIVCWKWQQPGYRSTFGPETVNTLLRMVRRNYAEPCRFICVTDDAKGLDPQVEVVPDWKDYANVPAPSGSRNPSCFRRLRAFAPDIGDVFGKRFVSMDLDVVITGDLMPLFDRPEDFVMFADTNPRTFYNGSLMMMTAGARSHVWTSFDPVRSVKAARAAGHFGSDQAIISHCLGPNEAKWTTADGVYSFRNHLNGETASPKTELPPNARAIIFHGCRDPWSPQSMRLDWVRRFYN
jgi:hypothetical protein